MNLSKIYTSLAHTYFICGILHMSHNIKHFPCQVGVPDTKDQECPKLRELDLFYLETEEKHLCSSFCSGYVNIVEKIPFVGSSSYPLCLKDRCFHKTEVGVLHFNLDCSPINLLFPLHLGSTDFFYKRPGSKYFRLCSS